MSNDFLPPDFIEPAATGRYMKLQKGDNRFRVLGRSIAGWEYWIESNGKRSPVRRRQSEKITTDELERSDGQAVKMFLAFPVWDYADGKVKILELTQKGIQKEMVALARDEDWGNPTAYDIAVTREGDGMETSYSVKPKPAKALTQEQQDAWKETLDAGFNLNALFDGGDPFTAGIDIEDIAPPAEAAPARPRATAASAKLPGRADPLPDYTADDPYAAGEEA